MNNNLFADFDTVSSKQWKQNIQFELKGADYNDTLVWKSNEAIHVKPFYHADDFDKLPNISNTKASQWHICQTIFVADVKKSNQKALAISKSGADSIKFIIPTSDISIDTLIADINLDKTVLFFELQYLSEAVVKQIKTLVPKAEIYLDIIGQLSKSGNWYKSLNDDFKSFQSLFKMTNSFSINSGIYQNAGANMVQQIAYTLAHANEYLNVLSNAKTNLKSANVIFNIAIGPNYFFEIAKLRALRKLWTSVAVAYQANTTCHIVAIPTKRNKTLYDYNTNLMRSTTECMSAILGGANTINNLPYDAIFNKSHAFSERIARNQLLVLKHESHFDKVDNPADGAYYIETITQQLSEKALDLFKDIEKQGGFLSQLKTGTIQRKIKESALKEQEQFNTGSEILVGTNKYANPKDKMKHALELYPFVKTQTRKTLIEPIIEKRLSEQLEQNRLKDEN